MGLWREKQSELITEALSGNDVEQRDISSGTIRGTLYYSTKRKTKKGAFMMGSFGENRRQFDILARRLASYGYFCLAIDHPAHYLSEDKLTLGNISMAITEGLYYLKNSGITSIAVIGHSLGAIGALYSCAGYDARIETEIYSLWDSICKQQEILSKLQEKILEENEKGIANPETAARFNRALQEIDSSYKRMKKIVLESIKLGVRANTGVTCYVLLAPPLNLKSFFSGLKILKPLPEKWVRAVWDRFVFKILLDGRKKAGYPAEQMPEKDSRGIKMNYLLIKNLYEFIDYMTSMKEPAEYMELVQKLSEFKADGKTNFFKYYMTKYIQGKPKLFIFGNNDTFLFPMFWANKLLLPIQRGRIEKVYKAFCINPKVIDGRVEDRRMIRKREDSGKRSATPQEGSSGTIHYGPFSHSFAETDDKKPRFFLVTDHALTVEIIRFIELYT